MIMPEKPEIDVWNEARDLLLRLESLTTELEQSLAGGPLQELPPLLEQRRQLRDCLDTLKKDHGILQWTGEPVPALQSIAQAEILAILGRLVAANGRIRHELEERMGSLRQKIAEVQRTRTANRLYQKRRRSIKGAFIDARR
jgi:hypothetical protein